jgi:pimeloyl-ACP methyl ester carboxylesterase
VRGYGSTRFLSDNTFRNGQQAALAADVVDLMDALKIPSAIIGGFDWGARSADIVAALWPQCTKALVSVDLRRRRAQCAAGGTRGIRQRHCRGRQLLSREKIGTRLSPLGPR